MDAAKLNSLEIIFKHKEYFDQKLIETIERLRKTNEKLENRIILKNITVQSLKHKIVSYEKKILDLNSVNKTLTLKLKEKEEEIIDISQMIKDLQNELEELKQMIFEGKIQDSKTMAAILAYESKYIRK